MITFDKNDKALSMIANALSTRAKNELDLALYLDKTMDEFCGARKGNELRAGSYAQLWELAGRVLRNPQLEDGIYRSYKKVPAMYFCTHYKNYFDAAPLESVYRYMEDLALWGMGALKVWFDLHHFRNMEEGEAESERILAILKYAKSMGLKTVLTTLGNEAFADSPVELRADWTAGHDGYTKELNDHYHLEICPSKPGGMEKIIEYRRQMLEVFKDAQPDYVAIGPYDEGGCSCAACAPWASNGFLRCVKALIPVIQEYFPDAKIVLGLWLVGFFRDGNEEYEGIQKALEHDFPEVEYLVGMFGSEAYKRDMHRPMLCFPEVSMTNTAPWGGYGANPMPKRFGDLWREHRDSVEGGWPYMEGIYADLNAVLLLREFRDNSNDADVVKEYLAYEFGLQGALLEKVCGAIYDMENTLYRSFDKVNHRYVIKQPEKVFDIEKVFVEANEALEKDVRESVKWQVLYLRAMIDGELKRNDYYRNEKVRLYFEKLIDISYLHHSGLYTKPDIEDKVDLNAPRW